MRIQNKKIFATDHGVPLHCFTQTAKKASPSIMESYAIFAREQLNTQGKGTHVAHNGQPSDILSKVEFQRDYR